MLHGGGNEGLDRDQRKKHTFRISTIKIIINIFFLILRNELMNERERKESLPSLEQSREARVDWRVFGPIYRPHLELSDFYYRAGWCRVDLIWPSFP